MEYISGAIDRYAQPARGSDAVHMPPQTKVSVLDRAFSGREVRVGIHEQVQLWTGETEEDMPIPAVAEELDHILVEVRLAFVSEVQGEAVVGHRVEQSAFVLEQTVENRRLDTGSLRHGACGERIPTAPGE